MNKAVNLKDSNNQKKLLDKGYVCLRSFIQEPEVKALTSFCRESGLFEKVKTQPNYLYLNPDKSWEINSLIRKELADSFKNHFSSGKLLGGVYMIKQSGENAEVDFHQDWSLVDENQHVSYNLWCPLVDTTFESGSLMVIEKSHKVGLNYRSSTMPPLEVKYDKKYDKFIRKFTLKAGDAILYRHSMFHGSGNNKGKSERLAIACGIIPNEVPFVYQHWDDEKKQILSYEVDEDFYISHIHEVLAGNIPEKYKCLKQTNLENKPTLTESDFYKKLKKEHGLKRFLFFDF